MPTTAASAHMPAAPSASFPAHRPVWQVSYLAGLVSSVIVETWGLAARHRRADEGRRHGLAPRDAGCVRLIAVGGVTGSRCVVRLPFQPEEFDGRIEDVADRTPDHDAFKRPVR
jgi:hypothetical protein